MRFNELNEDNFLLFAIKNYENPHCVTKDDFLNDLQRLKYIKRLLRKYHMTGILKSHLLLNHIIVIYNLFGEAGTPILFYKLNPEYWPIIKSFLIYLNRIDEFFMPNIQADSYCLDELNKL